MTKEEFKLRWESNPQGGDITWQDIAQCAMSWGVCEKPYAENAYDVRYKVLKAANTVDAEQYNFNPQELT